MRLALIGLLLTNDHTLRLTALYEEMLLGPADFHVLHPRGGSEADFCHHAHFTRVRRSVSLLLRWESQDQVEVKSFLEAGNYE